MVVRFVESHFPPAFHRQILIPRLFPVHTVAPFVDTLQLSCFNTSFLILYEASSARDKFSEEKFELERASTSRDVLHRCGKFSRLYAAACRWEIFPVRERELWKKWSRVEGEKFFLLDARSLLTRVSNFWKILNRKHEAPLSWWKRIISVRNEDIATITWFLKLYNWFKHCKILLIKIQLKFI